MPIYVSHAISKQIINAGNVKRERPNNAEYPFDPKYTGLKSDAMKKSGYDHGHMAPARDLKWSEEAWKECFYMTNMIAQHGCCNQRGWCYLESLTRHWAETAKDEEIIYIVFGVVPNHYKDTLCLSFEQHILVPSKIYKVVLQYNPKTKEAKGIGFIVENSDLDNQTALSRKTTIDEVEKLTNLDFFSFLDKKIENQTESKIGFTNFECKSECPDRPCESIYSRRPTPENRTGLKCR